MAFVRRSPPTFFALLDDGLAYVKEGDKTL
ncbi:MAG: hypothetical protein CM1200mP26_11720 [Acidimicrobiales bacterium]|nr:MAG: hypothetical protein CM1200mP26_11720 [Acidimicrobiales bacterium]